MKRLWRDYGLGIVLFGLFLVSWVVQTITGWWEFVAEQRSLGQTAVVFGDEGYVWRWAQATFENWQSESLQLLTMVVLTAYLVYRGSPESKDGQAEMQAAIERIERRLAQMTAEERRRAFGRISAD